MPTPASSLDGMAVQVSFAVIPEAGEDSFAFQADSQGAFLCVADGCGGLGGKRYGRMNGQTGAYLAARLATRVVSEWVQGAFPLPLVPEEGREVCASLEEKLLHEFQRFEAEHSTEEAVRIVGSMRRTLPTTLCTALLVARKETVDGMFLWAGDSRGYLLNAGGLHQMTEDHAQGGHDAMEGLYRDAPLSNFLTAEGKFTISARRVRTPKPCVVLVATDGAFAYLPTPMEFEWLLLSTLHGSSHLAGWQKRLRAELEKVASDDCTLLIVPYGYADFEALQADMEKRRLFLQREFITPVRRRKQNAAFATKKWREYREQYDQAKGAAHGEVDWRI